MIIQKITKQLSFGISYNSIFDIFHLSGEQISLHLLRYSEFAVKYPRPGLTHFIRKALPRPNLPQQPQLVNNPGKTVFRMIFILFLSLYLGCWAYAILPAQSTKIELSSQIDQTKVPLNRTLQLRVTLSWTGKADDYSLLHFDGPSLTNFEITGTATTKRSELIAGETRILNDYLYTLKSQELGMGYIEGVTAKVHNNYSDRDETLTTERIPVEIIDPVPDPEKSSFPSIFYGAPMVVLLLALLWFFRSMKKKRQPLPEPEAPIEALFLEELKDSLNLDQPNLREDFSRLSKLLRRYLSKKFSVRALETTSDELVRELDTTDMEENQISSVREILTRSDEIKFSGLEGSREELTRFYTLIEGILETFHRKSQEKTEMQSNKRS